MDPHGGLNIDKMMLYNTNSVINKLVIFSSINIAPMCTPDCKTAVKSTRAVIENRFSKVLVGGGANFAIKRPIRAPPPF